MHRLTEADLRRGEGHLREVFDPYIVAWLETGWTGIRPVRYALKPTQGKEPDHSAFQQLLLARYDLSFCSFVVLGSDLRLNEMVQRVNTSSSPCNNRQDGHSAFLLRHVRFSRTARAQRLTLNAEESLSKTVLPNEWSAQIHAQDLVPALHLKTILA
jgi:hypothetical protein